MLSIEKKVIDLFEDKFSCRPEVVSTSPGRINIIGEHTDYTGGISIPVAIDRYVTCSLSKRTDRDCFFFSQNYSDLWKTNLDNLGADLSEQWRKFVYGALELLGKRVRISQGVNILIFGDVPTGRGVSSSAAIELSLLNGLCELFSIQMDPTEIALMAQQIEHQFIGVKCGLLDQFASQFSEEGFYLKIDFQNLSVEKVKASDGYANYQWILVDSLVERNLSNSEYSKRVDEYQQALEIINRNGFKDFRSITSTELKSLRENFPGSTYLRAKHIVSENERTMKAFSVLESGTPNSLGELLINTHQSLKNDYQVSHPHLDLLVDFGLREDGVVGGRMMGGGFGGGCLFLVEKTFISQFSEKIARYYFEETGKETTPLLLNTTRGSRAYHLT